MILKAIDNGVTEERIALGLNKRFGRYGRVGAF
jgi:hypothetical protein